MANVAKANENGVFVEGLETLEHCVGKSVVSIKTAQTDDGWRYGYWIELGSWRRGGYPSIQSTLYPSKSACLAAACTEIRAEIGRKCKVRPERKATRTAKALLAWLDLIYPWRPVQKLLFPIENREQVHA